MSKAADVVKELKSKHEVCLLSDDDSPCAVSSWISTGCAVLDRIMGGGIPMGRITEIYGDPSTGKSLVASQLAGVAQATGVLVAYADTETAVSREMMSEVGVNNNDLIYSNPDTVEEVFSFFDDTVVATQKMAPDMGLLLIWDSVAATSSKAEMEGDYGSPVMADHARKISQGLRKFTRIIARQKVAVLLLNQTRQKIGVMFGDDTATFGGKAIPFHSSVRIELGIQGKIKVERYGKKRVIGMSSRAQCVKNKVAYPFQEATLPVYFGHGIDDALASFYYLKDNGRFEVKGSWYTFKINGKEHRFQAAGWSDIYYNHYDAIYDFIMGWDKDESDN